MITTKEIQLVPGVRVHTVGHLRVKLLELSPEECYVLPEAISIYNTGDYSVISSAGNRGHYIEKSYFYTISALRSLLSSHLNLCEEYFSEGQEYFGLPLISRPTCLDHSEVVSGYALPETLMTSMSYLDSLEYITKTLIPGLVRNQ